MHRSNNRFQNPASRPDSPLAKIFGFGSSASASTGDGTRRTAFVEPMLDAKGNASIAEVEGLKTEMKEVRESQLRMEEMLSKMIAGK